MANIEPGHRILEPSAGTGALVQAILRAEPDVSILAVERDRGRRAKLQALPTDAASVMPIPDCMALPGDLDPFDRAIMVPPFERCGAGDHLAHVHHAFGLLADGGLLVAVLPASVGFREDQRHRGFRDRIEHHGTINELPDSAFGFGLRTVVVRLMKPIRMRRVS